MKTEAKLQIKKKYKNIKKWTPKLDRHFNVVWGQKKMGHWKHQFPRMTES